MQRGLRKRRAERRGVGGFGMLPAAALGGLLVAAVFAGFSWAASAGPVPASIASGNETILFGGSGTAGLLNDTWSYTFASAQWSPLNPPTAPSPRMRPLLAADSRTGAVILFGGFTHGYPGLLNDTWSYDPATNGWTNRSPATHPETTCSVCPGATAMVYDSRADRVILFGANAPTQGPPNQTWAYDPNANTWTQRHPASAPLVGHDFAFVYDAAADRVLLFGGGELAPDLYTLGHNQTWSYDYARDTWTNLAPKTFPSGRYGAAMAYDTLADRTLLFGGCTSSAQAWPNCALENDTWAYDYGTNEWTNLTPRSSPPPNADLPMLYDAAADRFLVFGGGQTRSSATWTYDYGANSWAHVQPSTSPPARDGAGLVYVPLGTGTGVGGGGGAAGVSLGWTLTAVLVAVVAAGTVVLVWWSRRTQRPPPG